MADVFFQTSGSTGEAKPIVRTEAALAEDARRLLAAFPEIWSSRPFVVASVRPEHMYGALWRVRVPTLAGCAVAESTVFSVEELAGAFATHGPFLFVTTPSFLEKALCHPDFTKLRGAFRAIVTSGSLLRPETSRAVTAAIGVCPLEIYGSTEAGTVAWRRQRDGEDWMLVADVEGACDDDGRLVVRSPYAMANPLTMGDRVAFSGPRQFQLKGRADRRVKILERFVSLSKVEQALTSCPLVGAVRVEPFGEGMPRLGALLVPSTAGRDRLAQVGSSGVAAEVRTFLRGHLDDVAIPRRFRFVRELPVNAQGKTTASSVCAALTAWCREPVVMSWQATTNELRAEFVFPPDMECFQGHFPGFPILPGVAQLFFLRHFARQAFPDWPESATYRKLKFQKIVTPGRPLTLAVTRTAAGIFTFEFTVSTGRCTSGLIEGNLA